MKFVNLKDIKEWTIQGYGDAGFRSMPDRTSSCGGHVILLANKEQGLASILCWRSKKIKRVVSSSTAAEALAANDTLDEMIYIRCVLNEVLGCVAEKIPLELYTDCKNLHDNVNSSTLAENPRLRTDIVKLKNSLRDRELQSFVHVKGKDMIADVLTKREAPGFSHMEILRTGVL